MRTTIIAAAAVALTLAGPLGASAQVLNDTVNGTQNGYNQGNAAAGPIGGIVGGAVGAGVGAATGAIGTAGNIVGSIFGAPGDRTGFHDYAVGQHRRSFGYEGELQVGSVLPPRGVTLYPVPRSYHVSPRYRYAVVNDRTVIVDPRSRRVVDIID